VPTKAAAVVILSLFTLAGAPGSARAQAQEPKPAPKALDRSVISLHRAASDWRVLTTIWLAAETQDPTADIEFAYVQPPNGALVCDANGKPPDKQTSVACTYQPKAGYVGADRFTYTAKQGDRVSQPATVTIDVRTNGLRWELSTVSTTGLTSDNPDLSTLPQVIGKNSQDFLFSLNWQVAKPRQRLTTQASAAIGGPIASASDRASADRPVPPSAAHAVAYDRGAYGTRNINAVFRTGIVSDPSAVELKDLGPASGTPAGEADGETGTTQTAAVARRQFLVEAEMNYNSVLRWDGVGHFAEVGVIGKGSFSVPVSGSDSVFKTAGRLVDIISDEPGAFKAEGGARFALKQAHEEEAKTLTIAPDGRQANRPSNIDDVLAVDFLIQRDETMANLPTGSSSKSENRWALRFVAYPEVKFLSGHQRFQLGLEVSQPLKGGPMVVRVLYGVNLSLSKGLF
jgi:hypothetical protein